jgi:hypothetical protein
MHLNKIKNFTFSKITFKALACSKGLGFFGRGGGASTTPPVFEACPYTWKC